MDRASRLLVSASSSSTESEASRNLSFLEDNIHLSTLSLSVDNIGRETSGVSDPMTPKLNESSKRFGVVTRSFSRIKNPYLKQPKSDFVERHVVPSSPFNSSFTPAPHKPLVHVSGTFSGKPISRSSLNKAENILFSNQRGSTGGFSNHLKKPPSLSKPRFLNYDEVLHSKNNKLSTCSSLNESYHTHRHLNDLRWSPLSFNAIDPSSCANVVMRVTSRNAIHLFFDESSGLPLCLSNEYENLPGNGFGLNDFYRALISKEGISRDKISLVWVRNHFRWIVWKLASIERSFSDHFLPGGYLSKGRVLDQLVTRYDNELVKGRRSALRKVLNRDEPPCRLIILCVSQIIPCTQGLKKYKVELTDGW